MVNYLAISYVYQCYKLRINNMQFSTDMKPCA